MPNHHLLICKISERSQILQMISRPIDIYLEGFLTQEEYKLKKDKLVNGKKELQESLRDFAAGGDNWFERTRKFITTLNKASYVIREGNLESRKEFLEKIGSNFILSHDCARDASLTLSRKSAD